MTETPEEWALIEAWKRTFSTPPYFWPSEKEMLVSAGKSVSLSAHAITIQKHEKQPVDPVRAMVEYMADEHYTWESQRDRTNAIRLAEIACKRGMESVK